MLKNVGHLPFAVGRPPLSKLPTRPYNKTTPFAARPPRAAPPTKTYIKYETRGWPQIAPQAKFFFEVLIPLANFNFFYKIRYFLSKKSSDFLSVQFFFFIKNNLFLDIKKSSFLFSKMAFRVGFVFLIRKTEFKSFLHNRFFDPKRGSFGNVWSKKWTFNL